MKKQILNITFLITLVLLMVIIKQSIFAQASPRKKGKSESQVEEKRDNYTEDEEERMQELQPLNLQIDSYWGDIMIEGYDGTEILLNVGNSEATGGMNLQNLSEVDSELFEIKQENGNIQILDLQQNAATPLNFYLKVPYNTTLKLNLNESGNIEVNDTDNLVEIDNNSGSVQLDNLRGWAIVNAIDGEINANFEEVEEEKPMSFTTLNGSIYLTFPEDLQADIKVKCNQPGIINDFEKIEYKDDFDHGAVIGNAAFAPQNSGEYFDTEEKEQDLTFEEFNENDPFSNADELVDDLNADYTYPEIDVEQQKQIYRNKRQMNIYEQPTNGGGPIYFISSHNGIVEIRKKE